MSPVQGLCWWTVECGKVNEQSTDIKAGVQSAQCMDRECAIDGKQLLCQDHYIVFIMCPQSGDCSVTLMGWEIQEEGWIVIVFLKLQYILIWKETFVELIVGKHYTQ